MQHAAAGRIHGGSPPVGARLRLRHFVDRPATNPDCGGLLVASSNGWIILARSTWAKNFAWNGEQCDWPVAATVCYRAFAFVPWRGSRPSSRRECGLFSRHEWRGSVELSQLELCWCAVMKLHTHLANSYLESVNNNLKLIFWLIFFNVSHVSVCACILELCDCKSFQF